MHKVRQLPIEDICARFRHLCTEDFCVGTKQLQLDDMNWSQRTLIYWMLLTGARQLSMNKLV